jgi:hypothetical protein
MSWKNAPQKGVQWQAAQRFLQVALAAIIALCLAVYGAPISAFAASSDAEASAPSGTGSTIKTAEDESNQNKAVEGEITPIDIKPYLDKNKCNLAVEGVNLIENGEVVSPAPEITYANPLSVELTLSWNLPNSIQVTSGTTFTYKLPENINLNGKTGTLVNGSNTQGTFEIADGLVTITYTENMGSDVTGGLYLTGTLLNAQEGVKNTIKLNGLDEASFTLLEDTSTKGLKVSKECRTWVVGNTYLQQWVVAVTAKGENENVKVADSMGANLSYENESLKVYTDWNLQEEYTGNYRVSPAADGAGFTVDFDSLTNQTVYLAYNVEVSEKAPFDTTYENNKNTATVSGGLLGAGETVSASGQVWLSSPWKLSKTGEASKDGESITWTINLDTGGETDIAGTKLQDTLDTGLLAPSGYENSAGSLASGSDENGVDLLTSSDSAGDESAQSSSSNGSGIVIQQSNDGIIWKDSEISTTWAVLANGTFTFPGNSTARYYKISYTTALENMPTVGTKDFKNTVTAKPYGLDTPISVSQQVTAGHTNDNTLISKTCTTENETASELTWQIELNGSQYANLTDVSIEDTLLDNQGANHTINPGSLKVYKVVSQTLNEETGETLGDQATENVEFGNYTLELGKDYTLELSTDAKSFTIKFLDGIQQNEKFLITYTSSIADATKCSNGTVFKNSATLSANELASPVSVTAEHEYSQVTFNKGVYSESGEFTGAMKWYVELGANLFTLSPNAESVAVVDTLPENNIYVDKSLETWLGWDSSTKLSGVSAQVSEDGSQVTFTISGNALDVLKEASAAGNNSTIHLIYSTKLKDVSQCANWESNKYQEYTNSASLLVDGQTLTTSAAPNWKPKPTLVSKSAEYNSSTAPYANYQIAVNQSGLMLNNGNSLKLEDTMGTGLELKPETIQVSVDGKQPQSIASLKEEGFSCSFNQATNTLTIEVPDETPCVISYKVYVALDKDTDLTQENAGNTVKISGQDVASSSANLSGRVLQSSGWTSSVGCSLQVYKYGANDLTNALEGATFKVEKLTLDKTSGTTWKVAGTETVAENVTSKDTGYTPSVEDLLKDNIYRISETQAPDGYIAASPIYVVFAGNSAVDYSQITIIDEEGESHSMSEASADEVASFAVANTTQFIWYVNNNKKPNGIPALIVKPAHPTGNNDLEDGEDDDVIEDNEGDDEDKEEVGPDKEPETGNEEDSLDKKPEEGNNKEESPDSSSNAEPSSTPSTKPSEGASSSAAGSNSESNSSSEAGSGSNEGSSSNAAEGSMSNSNSNSSADEEGNYESANKTEDESTKASSVSNESQSASPAKGKQALSNSATEVFNESNAADALPSTGDASANVQFAFLITLVAGALGAAMYARGRHRRR